MNVTPLGKPPFGILFSIANFINSISQLFIRSFELIFKFIEAGTICSIMYFWLDNFAFTVGNIYSYGRLLTILMFNYLRLRVIWSSRHHSTIDRFCYRKVFQVLLI